MAFESQRAQVHAGVDYFLFVCGWAPAFAIVEGEGAKDAVVPAANRRRPTCFEVLAEWEFPVGGPTRIRLDIGHRNGGAQVRRGPAGADPRSDPPAVNGGAIFLRQARARKRMQTAATVQP